MVFREIAVNVNNLFETFVGPKGGAGAAPVKEVLQYTKEWP